MTINVVVHVINLGLELLAWVSYLLLKNFSRSKNFYLKILF